MKFGKILVSIYQPGSAAILNSIPGLEVIEGLDTTLQLLRCLQPFQWLAKSWIQLYSVW